MKKQIFTAAASLAVVAAMSVSAFAVDAGSTNGKSEATADLSKPVNATTSTGVQIEAASGVFGTEGTVTFDVDVEPATAEQKTTVLAAAEKATNVKVTAVNTVIDISAFIDGKEVGPNGEVKITVAWDGVSNCVIYVDDKGAVEVMPTDHEKDSTVISFTTKHFSAFYMVTAEEVSNNGNGSTDGKDDPDKNAPTGVVLAVIPAAIAAAAIVVSKKRK